MTEMTVPPTPPLIYQRPPQRRRWALWAMAGVLLVAIVGAAAFFVTRATSNSANSSPLQAPSPAGTASYIANARGYIVFLQWRQKGTHLSGTAQQVSASGSAPDEQVANQSIPFIGTLNGASITLSFAGAPSQFGTIANGSFGLDLALPSGGFFVAHFVEATPETFNDAVASLHKSVDLANQLASEQRAITNAQQTISNDASQVESDLSDLASAGSQSVTDAQGLQSEVQSLQNDLATTQSDLQTATAAAAQGASASPGSVCADAGTVAADAGSVEADAGSLQAAVQQVSSDLGAISSDISALNGDYSTLTKAEANLPSSQWPSMQLPTQGDISQTISQANAEGSQAVSITNGFIQQANNGVTTAIGYANQANQSGNCGSSSSPPTPLQPISS